jgi:hypothetical protein
MPSGVSELPWGNEAPVTERNRLIADVESDGTLRVVRIGCGADPDVVVIVFDRRALEAQTHIVDLCVHVELSGCPQQSGLGVDILLTDAEESDDFFGRLDPRGIVTVYQSPKTKIAEEAALVGVVPRILKESSWKAVQPIRECGRGVF